MWWLLWHLGSLLAQGFDLALMAGGAVLVVLSYGSGLLGLASGGIGALLAGPVGKVARWVGIGLILAGGCRLYVARQIAAHDAQQQAAAEVAIAKAQADFYQRGAKAAAAQAAADAAIARSTERVRTVILHDRATCTHSPALDAAFGELRRRAAAAGQVPPPR